MDLQRAAGQRDVKRQQNPQPQAPHVAPRGAGGFAVRLRIAVASRALQVRALGTRVDVGFAFGVDFADFPDRALLHLR